MEKTLITHKGQYKKKRTVPAQEQRRELAFLRQKQARQDKHKAFRLAHAVNSDPTNDLNTPKTGTPFSPSASELVNKKKQSEQYYAKQLQIPEWMIDIPSDLQSNWLVMARPEGKHCLVISSNGSTIARERSGRLLHRFNSRLPNGSPSSMQGSGDFCILDCIFNEEQETIYVLDFICWKGYSMYDCTADFRFHWVQWRLGEIGNLANSDEGNDFSIALVPYYNCTPEGIMTAYNGTCMYQRDGLLFYNKSATYWCGLTPLVLKWKDSVCSRFPIDTPDGINPFPIQTVVLQLKDDFSLVTLGEESLGSVPVDFASEKSLKPGDLLRFSISGVTFGPQPEISTLDERQFHHQNHHLNISLQNMNFVEKCKISRSVPDSSCKIAFQFLSRNDPTKIEAIVQTSKDQSINSMDTN